MKRSVRKTLQNPLIIIPPIIAILGLGWQQYTYAGRNLSLPTASINLLADSNFDNFTPHDLPNGWTTLSTGALNYTATRAKGYASGNSMKLTISNYQNGDVMLSSPEISVQPNTTYLFKGYYNADIPFTLLLRSYFKDGTNILQSVGTYDAIGTSWSMVSDAFKATPDLTAVQLVFRTYSNGSLTLNTPYLQPAKQVYIPPEVRGNNTIPNGQLTDGAYDIPTDWSTYHSGNNTAAFSYVQDKAGSYLQTSVTGYKSGQAKWQYAPQQVSADQRYAVSLAYQSNTSIPLVAEYALQSGSIHDTTIATLPPADSWTTVSQQFQVPPGATTLFIAAPLEHTGTVATRNYNLINTTTPGPSRWRQPLVSLAFDDGWQTTYDNTIPILKKYNYLATFYVNPSTIETPSFMTASQLSTVFRSGNEIGSNGYDHDDLTAINDSSLVYQLSKGRNYLRAAGFPVTDLALPYGRSDAEVQWYARQYYTTVVGTTPGINTRQNLMPYDLKVLNVTSNTTRADISTALETTKRENGWLILNYHRVTDDPFESYGSLNVEHISTATTSFEKHIALVHDSGIKVLPIETAYQEVSKQ